MIGGSLPPSPSELAGFAQDNSPEAYIPTIGEAGNTITVITLMFMAVMVFVFWLSRLGVTKQAEPEAVEVKA